MSHAGRPERSCVGCRGRASKSELIRLVRGTERLVLDRAQRLPGRGAYLHLDLACWQQAAKRRSVERSVKAPAAWSRSASTVLELYPFEQASLSGTA